MVKLVNTTVSNTVPLWGLRVRFPLWAPMKGYKMIRMRQSKCLHCGEINVYETDEINHVLHAIIGILTAGLWFWVWLILVVMYYADPDYYYCANCGEKLF